MNIFIKCNTGNTLAVDLDPKWDIKNIKNIIAPRMGAQPEEVKIILAGRELEDSIVIKVGIEISSFQLSIEFTRLLYFNVIFTGL